jgi:hypothetical protein
VCTSALADMVMMRIMLMTIMLIVTTLRRIAHAPPKNNVATIMQNKEKPNHISSQRG